MTQVKREVTIRNGAAIAKATLGLSVEDYDIVQRSGPLKVQFGGSFTLDGQAKTLKENEQTITVQTITVTEKFSDGAAPSNNEQQALDWLAEVVSRIQTALGAIRVADANLVGGDPVYTAI